MSQFVKLIGIRNYGLSHPFIYDPHDGSNGITPDFYEIALSRESIVSVSEIEKGWDSGDKDDDTFCPPVNLVSYVINGEIKRVQVVTKFHVVLDAIEKAYERKV
jgi:hypothetical protein